MLMDDLMQYGRGNRDLDRRVKNKCEADLIYYIILKEMLSDYGVDNLRDISDIDPDALCIARNQMATLASDDRLLEFDGDERVTGFYNPDTGRMDREFTDASRAHFIRESILNCEALSAAVSTHLASSPAYRGVSMTDDEFDALVRQEIEQRAMDPDNPNSLFSRVLRAAGTFNGMMGENRSNDYYAMAMPKERMVHDDDDAEAVMAAERARRDAAQASGSSSYSRAYPGRTSVSPGDKILDLDRNGRPQPVMGLKLSPLMPEFEVLRRSGMGDPLGLYKDQNEHARTKDPRAYDKNNGVIMFDAQKRMLTPAPDPARGYIGSYLNQSRGTELAPGNGLLFGGSEYLDTQGYASVSVSYLEDGYSDPDSAVLNVDMSSATTVRTTALVKTNAGYNSSFRSIHAWKMAQILEGHSGQQLNDKDFSVIRRMMESSAGSNGTLFGDPEKDGEDAVGANAAAYFDYIAHVCSDVRSRMQSHEFGIHFEEQNYFADRNGFVPLLYFTGERTEEYNRARSNPSRYFAFYPFASYTPANIDVSPLAGDIAPAAYNSFTVTDVGHRRSATDTSLADPSRNKYAHVTQIDRDMAREMRALYDNYASGAAAGITGSGVRLTKIRRRVGDTGLDDLARFINPDGSVNGAMVTKALVQDMNITKAVTKEEFLQPSNFVHMRRIFDRFSARYAHTDGSNVSEGLDQARLGDAIAMFVQDNKTLADLAKKNKPVTIEDFTRALADELDECTGLELRSAYGQDINSYRAMRHIYKAYLNDFVTACTGQFMQDTLLRSRRDVLPDLSEGGYGFDNDTYKDLAEGVAQRMRDASDPVLRQSLKDLFGTGEFEDENNYVNPDVPQRIVLKANMGRYSSTQFLYQDYNDLLQLLSYSGYVKYETDMGRAAGDVISGLDNRAPIAVQLYAAEAYGSALQDGDIPDDDAADDDFGTEDDNNGSQSGASATDDRLWFDSVFADPDEGAVTLEWLEADYSGDPGVLDEGRRVSDDPRFEHAVYEAQHPLKCAALRRCGEILSRTERDFDPARLKVSRQGLISYSDANGAPVFRIGPVIDEEAYIRPVVVDDPDGTEAMLPVRDANGTLVRDSHGTVLTEKRRVTSLSGYHIDADGKLANPVDYGALDRLSLLPEGQAGNAGNNRFYGISAKIRPYSGYDHTKGTFIDRMEFSTYQSSVLANIERCLGMHAIAKNSDGNDGIARSLFYTNVGPASLQKCYQTNTYLMDNPAKSKVAGDVMRGYVALSGGDPDVGYEDVFPVKSSGNDELFDHAMGVAGVHLTESKVYRSRVVFAKISIDQNIGLYNQAVNLHQCSARDSGRLDVKSMRDTDSKGARVAMFQYNTVLDPVLSGTAKSLGAVAYFTDNVRFDPITCSLAQDISAEDLAAIEAGEKPVFRCAYISQGVEDFETGSLTNLAPHTGGQAFDRQQLSSMGGMKSLNIVPDVKFAMVNLGFNMEDGYIVAKRAAEKLGHFESDGEYVPLKKWDKIGDSESGNKGIVSKIVDTDIGLGMDDDEAADEFMARYLYDYLMQERVNYGGPGAGGRHAAFWDAFQHGVDKYIGHGQHADMKQAFGSLECDVNGEKKTVAERLDRIRTCMYKKGKKAAEFRAEADVLREAVFQAVKPALVDIGLDLEASRVQPFTGSYRVERDVWQMFRDNPDLDIAVTNVCVCTRSNPSILMNIGEACDRDRAGMEADGVDMDDAGAKAEWLLKNGESALVMRGEDDHKVPVMGAKGQFAVYVDSHTADDKNIDYNKNHRSPKDGRRQAAQEGYALQAERCCEAYYAFMLANDPALPDNLMKWNRKLAMNGFLFDLADENLRARKISDVLDEASLDELDGSDGLAYTSESMPGVRFVDLKSMARDIVAQIPAGAKQEDIVKAVAALGEDQDFSKLLLMGKNRGGADMTAGSKSIDDKLRYMFVSALGQDGGGVVLLPDSLEGADLDVDIGLKETVSAYDDFTGQSYDKKVAAKIPLDGSVTMPDGSKRRAAPLFLSSREITNPDAELVTAPVDDRMQFRAFKAALAGAVAEELYHSDLIPEGDGHGRVPMLPEDEFDKAKDALCEKLTKLYKSAPSEQSLSLDGMNGWAKKNVYYLALKDSLTCVWNGDPTIGIDEVGISFEKAKSLGLLKPKEGLSKEELRAIPDTYEFMHERYEPLGEDSIIMVNRSPGQTTGCIRAFYPRIIGATGDGMSINPACATIFDGDFDGDTVCGTDPLFPCNLRKGTAEYEEMAAAARAELQSRMSMKGNMVHEADYTEIGLPDGGEIPNVHPLFIARNADYAVALHNMKELVPLPDDEQPDGAATGDVEKLMAPACGYDVGRELDSITVMANMLYELRNSAYDYENGAKGLIGMSGAKNIADARGRQIDAMAEFFEQMDMKAGTDRDRSFAKFWQDTYDSFKSLREGFQSEAPGSHEATKRGAAALETAVFARFREVYGEMAGFLSSKPLMTHGETQHEILYNVIKDANISKKGKEPQLNALLSYSSTAECCGGRLSVVKNADKKFELLTDGKPTTEFSPDIKMSNENPVSDVPKSTFRSQIESHTVAQSDKSDATGMGGAMAQKMQKLFSPAGYGGFGLRISGPITQSYLDAKQNVTKCGNNLKIGKFVLDMVAKFQKFDEFTDEAMEGADLAQVFRGQYTRSVSTDPKTGKQYNRYMTVDECVEQMDNFIQVMGHPGFTEIDKAIASAVLAKYETQVTVKENGKKKEVTVVKDPVRQADATGDVTYAIMYGGDKSMPEILAGLEESGRGPFSGSFGFDGKVDAGRIRKAVTADPQDGKDLSESMGRILSSQDEAEAPGLAGASQETAADLIRAKTSSIAQALSQVEPDVSEETVADTLAQYNAKRRNGAAESIKGSQDPEGQAGEPGKDGAPKGAGDDDLLAGLV